MPTTINRAFTSAQFTSILNPATSYSVYDRYRSFAMTLLDTTDPELYYKPLYNAIDSFNGEGLHEKFVYHGRSILDVSIGLLDYPWYSADASPQNEITAEYLQMLANNARDLMVAPKLRAIANFVSQLPSYTRLYYYEGVDCVKAITVVDEFNGVKFAYQLSHCPSLFSM